MIISVNSTYCRISIYSLPCRVRSVIKRSNYYSATFTLHSESLHQFISEEKFSQLFIAYYIINYRTRVCLLHCPLIDFYAIF